MTKTSARRAALTCALLAATAACGLTAAPAAAQSGSQPAYRQPDGNGVDVTHGDYLMAFVEGSIGSGESALELLRQREGNETSQWDRITYTRIRETDGDVIVTISLGTRFETFVNGQSTLAVGSTLTQSGSDFFYTVADGTRIVFSDPTSGINPDSTPFCSDIAPVPQCTLLPSSIVAPDGRAVDLAWSLWGACDGNLHPVWGVETCAYDWRLAEVGNSAGYRIELGYASGGSGGQSGAPASWYQRTSAGFFNGQAGSSALATVSYARPSAGVTEVTDTGGLVWRFTGAGDRVTAIRRPGASADTTTIAYTNGIVSSVTNEGVTTSYSRSVSGSTGTMTITNALSQVTTVVSDLDVGRPTSITDPLGRTTSWQYDSNGRLTRVTAPEGNYVQYSYDSRGNVTQTQVVPKSGSGQSTITTSASFDSTCPNPVTCNSPNSTTDARGNTTDYTYDPDHGGLLTVTGPAPTAGATRPQTRYVWTLDEGSGEYRLTGVAACQTQAGSFDGNPAACAGGADEAKTSFVYDSNGNVTSVSSGNGSGTLTATTAMTWDAIGNLVTVDGPLSGTADTSKLRYNGARQLVGTIGPDPDGGGSLKHRAVRNTYTNGLPTKVERGTVNSQSDADWAAFAGLEAVETSYDTHARPTVSKLVAGGATHALTQTGYDALGRVECVAVRMDPNDFGGTLPAACTPTSPAGSHGLDRIVKTVYDELGRAREIRTAVGTSLEAAEQRLGFTPNGLVETVKDGENNLTTFEYDGHDRLAKTRYPSPTKGAGTSSTTDYEQSGYDAAGNVISFRNRAGETIGFTFDALNRLTAKNLPGTEPDVSYSYDLLGRMTGASQSGQVHGFTWDALGRNLTQTSPMGTNTISYDAAGRRTRFEYAGGGLYMDYDYLVTGEVTRIRENFATTGVGVLAAYAYDDLGRRTSLTRGNGTTATYSYDAASRLSQIVENLAGTGSDLTLGFGYNPAGQIVENSRSNDSYAFAPAAASAAETANGLNQLASRAGVNLTYDARGNLTSDGARTFAYSSENLLTSAGGGIALKYDPLMRLWETSGGASGTTKFVYDGLALTAEYNASSAIVRRYAHGPGPSTGSGQADEPIVWYEGSSHLNRRFLHTDERGSVVAMSDSAGNIVGTPNAYDEYGVPESTNAGRFQYTGQTWLSELGLHYYKARMYDPGLGRFPQPDPIGYRGGMNLYAYVGGDPINFIDPTGTSCWSLRLSWHWYKRNGEYIGPTGEPDTVVYACPSDSGPFSLAGGVMDGAGSGAGTPDRCAAKETPPMPGGLSYFVDAAKLASVAQLKFQQHSWRLRPDGRLQSVFSGGQINSGADAAAAAWYLVATRTHVPSGGLNVRITGDMGFTTGFDNISDKYTTYLTVILGPPIPRPGKLPERNPVSVYPGCP